MVTVEIENVSIEGLTALKAMGVQVLPDPSHLALIRDKGTQRNSTPAAAFRLRTSRWSKMAGPRCCPGSARRAEAADRRLRRTWRAGDSHGGRCRRRLRRPCVLEDAVDIDKELSVIVARSTTGEVKTYPVVESVFNELNLVDYLVAPARITEAVADEARCVALSVVEAMDFVGCSPSSSSSTRRGRILVNEVAPRAHNSGHHTIEACGVPVRAAPAGHPGLPLGDVPMDGGRHAQPDWRAGRQRLLRSTPASERRSLSPACTHTSTARRRCAPGRKMGHVTLLAETADAAEQRVKDLRDHISTVHAH